MKTTKLLLLLLLLTITSFYQALSAQSDSVMVTFTGGYETNPVDHGRPVILIASTLEVPAEVFRDAFSKVKPAPAGEEPDPAQVKLNKQALLNTLAPYGVTNDTLDKVSNYYRYADNKGEVWKRRPAEAIAIMVDNKIIGFKIIDGGNGYTSAPIVSVAGSDMAIKATLIFSKNFNTNGSVATLTVMQ